MLRNNRRSQKLENPYTFGVPVHDKTDFFGREEELKTIFNTLENVPRGQKQDLVVMGPRRIGKSSLLYRLADSLNEKGIDFIAVYIDVQSVKPRKNRVLFLKILMSIQGEYKHSNLHIELPEFKTLQPGEIYADMEFLIFSEDMKELNDLIKREKLPRLVLLFDEIELLMEFGGMDTLEWFRSLIQSMPYIIFVVAGSERLYALTQDYGSPFYNIFKTIELRSLTDSAAQDLLLVPADKIGMEISRTEVEKILRYAGNNPYFIQGIAHYLVEELNTQERCRVQPHDVDKILKESITNLSAQFAYIWGITSQVEKVILYALAKKKTAKTSEEVIAGLSQLNGLIQSHKDREDIFRNLLQQQILKQEGIDRYWFSIPLLADWILSEVEYEKVAPLDSQTYEHTTDIRRLRLLLDRVSDVELESFVLDNFSPVYDRFSRGMRKDEKINLLLDYVRRTPYQFYELHALLKIRYPTLYDSFFVTQAESSVIQVTGKGISVELIEKLRYTLLRCGPFSSNSELGAVFVDSRISVWRERLPEMGSPASRVEATIDFLSSQYNARMENALVLLLIVLADRTSSGDACHAQLRSLADEIQAAL